MKATTAWSGGKAGRSFDPGARRLRPPVQRLRGVVTPGKAQPMIVPSPRSALPGSALPGPGLPGRMSPRLVLSGTGLPRAAGLLLGGVLDALLADPRRAHPVAAFGAAAVTGFPSVSDLAHLSGKPAIVFGPGNPDQSHAADESIALSALARAPEIYRRAIAAYFA